MQRIGREWQSWFRKHKAITKLVNCSSRGMNCLIHNVIANIYTVWPCLLIIDMKFDVLEPWFSYFHAWSHPLIFYGWEKHHRKNLWFFLWFFPSEISGVPAGFRRFFDQADLAEHLRFCHEQEARQAREKRSGGGSLYPEDWWIGRNDFRFFWPKMGINIFGGFTEIPLTNQKSI